MSDPRPFSDEGIERFRQEMERLGAVAQQTAREAVAAVTRALAVNRDRSGGWRVLDADGWRKCAHDEPGAVYLSKSGRVVECTPNMIVTWPNE